MLFLFELIAANARSLHRKITCVLLFLSHFFLSSSLLSFVLCLRPISSSPYGSVLSFCFFTLLLLAIATIVVVDVVIVAATAAVFYFYFLFLVAFVCCYLKFMCASYFEISFAKLIAKCAHIVEGNAINPLNIKKKELMSFSMR